MNITNAYDFFRKIEGIAMKVHGKYRYGLSAYEQAIRLCLYILGFWQRQQGENNLTREVLQFHTWSLPISREKFANYT